MCMQLFDNVGKEFPVELDVQDDASFAVLIVKLEIA